MVTSPPQRHVGDPDAAVDAAADAEEQPEEADKTLMAVEPENTMGDILEMSRGDNNMSCRGNPPFDDPPFRSYMVLYV